VPAPITEEEWIEVDSRRINCLRSSAPGMPVVFLHGVTRRWQSFLPLLSGLTPRWQTFAIDFRGHGLSDRTPGEYRVVDYVPDVVKLLKRLEEPAVVYGHSLGAMVAAAVAAQVPDAVRALVMEDPPFETLGSRLRETTWYSFFEGVQSLAGSSLPLPELAGAVANLQLVDPQTDRVFRVKDQRGAVSLRFAARCLSHLDPETLAPLLSGRWMEEYNRTEILRRITCPTLLLQADPSAGGMLIDTEAEEAERLISDCIRIKLPETPHLIHWERTQQTLGFLHAFLGSLD